MGASRVHTADMDRIMEKYYGDESVLALILMRVDTKEIDTIANDVSRNESIEDVYLITGDSDIFLKGRFRNYAHFKEFIMKTLACNPSIKESRTMLVVRHYKERGTTKKD